MMVESDANICYFACDCDCKNLPNQKLWSILDFEKTDQTILVSRAIYLSFKTLRIIFYSVINFSQEKVGITYLQLNKDNNNV